MKHGKLAAYEGQVETGKHSEIPVGPDAKNWIMESSRSYHGFPALANHIDSGW